MKKWIKFAATLLAYSIILINTVLNPLTAFAWGDSDGGRPSYTVAEINEMSENGDWAKDFVVFNSISDGAIGHEFNYVGAREYTGTNAGSNNIWCGDDITVEDGKVYIIRLYVHNNNPWGYEGVAENTKVSFNIPAYSASQIKINGFLTASNATPYEYVDYVNLNSVDGTPFHVEVKYNTALFENGNENFALGGVELDGQALTNAAVNSDGSWQGGVLIGYDDFDGRMPGCFKYDGVVTIQVKVIYDYEFAMEAKVRSTNSGGMPWDDSVEAKVGDLVDFRIEYRNTSDQTQTGVAIRDLLPSNLSLVEGSIKVWNSNNPDGKTVDDISLFETGLMIGSYSSGANAYITFTAKVVDEDLADGSNALVNWGQAAVGDSALQDYARVVVQKANRLEIAAAVLAVLIVISIITIIALLHKLRHLK